MPTLRHRDRPLRMTLTKEWKWWSTLRSAEGTTKRPRRWLRIPGRNAPSSTGKPGPDEASDVGLAEEELDNLKTARLEHQTRMMSIALRQEDQQTKTCSRPSCIHMKVNPKLQLELFKISESRLRVPSCQGALHHQQGRFGSRPCHLPRLD